MKLCNLLLLVGLLGFVAANPQVDELLEELPIDLVPMACDEVACRATGQAGKTCINNKCDHICTSNHNPNANDNADKKCPAANPYCNKVLNAANPYWSCGPAPAVRECTGQIPARECKAYLGGTCNVLTGLCQYPNTTPCKAASEVADCGFDRHCGRGDKCFDGCTKDANCQGPKTCQNKDANGVGTCKPPPGPRCNPKYDSCRNGFYCNKTSKRCKPGCKKRGSFCKTDAGKHGKCNGNHECKVPVKVKGSSCSTKVNNDCGDPLVLKCVATKKGYHQGKCHPVAAIGGACGKGRLPAVCRSTQKCVRFLCVNRN